MNHHETSGRPRGGAAWLLLAAAVGLGPWSGAAGEPLAFDTPEAALERLLSALGDEDVEALLTLVGPEYREAVIGADEKASRQNRTMVRLRAQEMSALREDGEDRRILVVGRESWPLPVPLVRGERGWFWDLDEGLEEVINRRVGRNELNAIAVLRAYVDAQVRYAETDRDGDRVREYAQRLDSSEGQRDGLYWDSAEDGEESPFGPLVAEAEDYLRRIEPGDPYFGYHFKILTRQGEGAPGGRLDYIMNGNMIAGFAMIAYPAQYDSSGVMTFVVSHQGEVLQRDLGELGHVIGATLDSYDPDDTWSPVRD